MTIQNHDPYQGRYSKIDDFLPEIDTDAQREQHNPDLSEARIRQAGFFGVIIRHCHRYCLAAWCRYRQCSAKWRSRRQLLKLEPHELDDIGITRAEAEREAAKGFFE